MNPNLSNILQEQHLFEFKADYFWEKNKIKDAVIFDENIIHS